MARQRVGGRLSCCKGDPAESGGEAFLPGGIAENIRRTVRASGRVKAAQAEQKTAGGIIIPDTAKEKPQRGEVVAVGNGKKDEPMTVKVGDVVLYGKYAGTELELDGEKFLIMRQSDVLAIVG